MAGNDDLSTVVCAPVYNDVLGVQTEVPVGTEESLPRECGIRYDFLMLMFKTRLTGFVSTLSPPKQRELRRALARYSSITEPY